MNLKEFIDKAKSQGLSKGEIYSGLKEKGYNKGEIDEAYGVKLKASKGSNIGLGEKFSLLFSHPIIFFERVKEEEDLGEVWKFLGISLGIFVILSVFVNLLFGFRASYFLGAPFGVFFPFGAVIPQIIIFSIFILISSLVCLGAGKIFGAGEEADFKRSFEVLAYSCSAFMIFASTIIGFLPGLVYFAILATNGFSGRFKIGRIKGFFVSVAPLIVSFILLLVLLFILLANFLVAF